jgi:hypothetical protein
MHDLERLITEWRKTTKTESGISDETLDELENHLRETVDQLVRSGMAVPEAFHRAVTELGSSPTIASEFQKLERVTWLPVKIVFGIGAVMLLALTILLTARFEAGRTSFLLASHVFTVTLGYTTTFLVGALGICFVGQRCASDFPTTRTRSLTRLTLALGSTAAGLTAIGTILAMIWAKAEWGRYWAWDAKEVGSFCVLIWQACFLLAHRFAYGTARGILVMSVLGNVVVSLAWFGSNMFTNGLHSYGMQNYLWLLLAAVICNLAIFLAGLAPAGWLRLRKA